MPESLRALFSGPQAIPATFLLCMTAFCVYQAMFPEKGERWMRWHMDFNNRFMGWFGMRMEYTIVDPERYRTWIRLWSLLMLVAFAGMLVAISKSEPGRAANKANYAEAVRLAKALLADIHDPGANWRSRLLSFPNNPRLALGQDGKEYLANFLLRHCPDGRLESQVVISGPRGEYGYAYRCWDSPK